MKEFKMEKKKLERIPNRRKKQVQRQKNKIALSG